jgi:hypothetical protein
MIAENPHGAVIESNIEGERFAMGIDPEAYLHLMSVLENLYSNVQYSVLREVAVNALDSHIEAGTDRPIEVRLPTRSEPVLTIQDWGVGLSKDDIRDIYSQYGKSTKRSTNAVAGMLGVGCKSPFAYSKQFTVTAVKDGVLIRVVVAKDPDGASMTIIDEYEVNDPNGVKVSIPCGTWNQFAQHARNLFRFWPKGSVLVDGERPATIEGIWISPTMMVTTGVEEDYLLMGSVPYPIERANCEDYKVKLDNGNHLVTFAPIGSVDFAPSREVLRYTTKTKRYLSRVSEEFEKAIGKAVQRTVNEADTKVEAFKRCVQWRSALAGSPQAAAVYTYKGEEIPREFKVPDNGRLITTEHGSYKKSSHSRQQAVYAGTALTSLFVYGYDETKGFSAPKKNKLEEYTYTNMRGVGVRQYVLVKDRIDNGWIDPARIVHWSVIEAIKLDRANGGRTKDIPGSYEVISGHHEVETAANDLDNENLYYVNKDDRRGWGERYNAAILIETHLGGDTVIVPRNRLNKFKRDFPGAVPVIEGLKTIFIKNRKGIRKDAFLVAAIKDDWHLRRMLEKIDPNKLDDPAFAKVKKLLGKSIDPKIKFLRDHRYLVLACGMPDPRDNTQVENPFDKYPLFDMGHLEHSYLYANMIYRMENK